MTDRILVIGSRGKTGSRVAALLAEQGIEVALATRDPRRPLDRRFDWSDANSLAAFAGCDAAYLVAPTDRTDHLAVMRPLLEGAIANGTRRFVLLSSSLLEPGMPMMAEVHGWLRERAPEWAVLRPSWFMQNFAEGPHARSLRDDGVLYSATGAGRVGFIDAGDIAASAVAALTAPAALNGDRVLTGPEALSYDDVAAIVSERLKRPIVHISLDPEDLARRHMGQGLPKDYAETLAAMDSAIRVGAEARVTTGVEALTGRRPVAFRDFAAANWGER
jgi:uncharacterized protein YbjT (DUF2867 family)